MSETTHSTIDWGRTRYEPAWREQEKLVARRIAGEIPDTLVFTEHDAVFTIGLHSGSEQHLVWDADALARERVEVVRTNRGGDITYHGPGQIVGYPVVGLAPRKDLHAYLRFLEEVLIRALAHPTYNLITTRRPGLTGIWVGTRKIAAIGVAVKRWIAYHGFALNVNTHLAHFGGIIPCGIASSDGTVTSMQSEFGRYVDPDAVKRIIDAEFWNLFPRYLDGSLK